MIKDVSINEIWNPKTRNKLNSRKTLMQSQWNLLNLLDYGEGQKKDLRTISYEVLPNFASNIKRILAN